MTSCLGDSDRCGSRGRYVAGCREEPCRTANRDYERIHRAGGADPVAPVGSTTAHLARLFEANAGADWLEDARCAELTVELTQGPIVVEGALGAVHHFETATELREAFFPARGEPLDPARAICRQCPVRTDCLEYALAANEQYGIWAGTSERDRRRIKKQRRAPQREGEEVA